VANKIKKVIRDGTSPNNVRDELGDVLWYLAMLSTEIGYSLDTIADKNLWKLAKKCARWLWR